MGKGSHVNDEREGLMDLGACSLHVTQCRVVYYESIKREQVVYYESLKRALKTKTIYGYRCDERLKTNASHIGRATVFLFFP